MNKTYLTSVKLACVATAGVAIALAVGNAANAKQKHHHGGIQIFMNGADADGNNNLTKDELLAKMTLEFANADTDKSQSLSKDELQTFIETKREARAEKRKERRAENGKSERQANRDRKGGMRKDKRQGMRQGKRLDAMFTRFDANSDGMIGNTEAEQEVVRVFTMLDVDKSGMLEPSEYQRKGRKGGKDKKRK